MSEPYGIDAPARAYAGALGLLAALLWLLTVPCSVHGQAAGQDSPAYRRAIERAVAAYSAGELATAHGEFARAHELYPNARTLRGLGSIELELKDHVAAARHLDEALRSRVLPLEGALRSAAESSLREASQHVARVRASVEPPDAEVRLDGQPLAAGDSAIVAPGDHTLTASAPHYAPHAQTLTLRAGGEEWVSIVLQRSASEPARDAPDARERTRAPWLVIGGGGAALATGAVLLALLPGRVQAMDDADDYEHWLDARKEARILLGTGAALAGVGALAVAGGLVWRQRLARRDVVVSLTPTGLVAAGRF